MASMGRGRGWAKATENEVAPRRPGQSNVQTTSEVEELINKIYDLDIDATPQDHENETVNFINNYITGLNDQNTEFFDKLFQQAMDNPCFAVKYIKFFKSRNLYTQMQACYERRTELCHENPSHLISLTWMLGILGAQQRGHKLSVLGGALINCLDLLLDMGTEDDLECVAIQLYIHGKLIREHFDKIPSESMMVTVGFSGILNKVRSLLINRNVSSRSRALLLLIIDLAHQHYEPFTGELQAFYMKTLEPSQGSQNDSKFADDRELNQQMYLYKLLSKGAEPKNEKAPLDKCEKQPKNEAQRNEQTQKVQAESNPGPVPRAIRGAGASDGSKDFKNQKKSYRPHKEKLTDKQVWSAKQNTGSKVWGHDDRFDNDYE